ncbi:Peptidase C1A, papain C-terminal [Parasponia andersonii]|uniref:Peptidase C1A, papain C-terminal n=1 Tax=Parasponia andersonii TaxID=3476 RepID=A0A2P5AS43_PARAD|nr:Peptidase C1A, papain C-terminal [Parasponia andersonii]
MEDLRDGFYAISAAMHVIAEGIPLLEHYSYVGVPLAHGDVISAFRRWLHFRMFHVGRYIYVISNARVYESRSIDWNSRMVLTMITRAPVIFCLHAGQAFVQFHADSEDACYDRTMEDNIQTNNWFYHYVIVYGYNIPNGYFNILNSWGQGWGFNGRARIRFDPNLIDRIVEVVPILPQNQVYNAAVGNINGLLNE